MCAGLQTNRPDSARGDESWGKSLFEESTKAPISDAMAVFS